MEIAIAKQTRNVWVWEKRGRWETEGRKMEKGSQGSCHCCCWSFAFPVCKHTHKTHTFKGRESEKDTIWRRNNV